MILCRNDVFDRYTLSVLAELAAAEGISEMSDEQIVQWANNKV